MNLIALFDDYTLRNAVLGAVLLGVSSGTLSAFAFLRRQSLLGDALAHAALPGICLGFLLTGSRQMLPILGGALASGVAAALFLVLLTRRSRIKEDAGLGIVLSLFFALGTVLLTYIQGRAGSGQAGLETFLFGQAAAVLPQDLWVMGVLTVTAAGLIAALFKEAKLVTFDPGFARSLGLPVTAIDLGLTLLVAVAVVLGLQLVGVVLMSAMLVAPAAAARQWSRHLGSMVLLSAGFAALSGVTGAVTSASMRGMATGPVIVLSVSVLVIISLLFAPERGIIWSAYRLRRHQQSLAGKHLLLDLHHLANTHNDPDYPSEQGMLDSLYGYSTHQHFKTLEHQGLVRQARHMQEEGPHWMLTPAGQSRAEALVKETKAEQDDDTPEESR